jgi:phosphatidylserine/phosphatidylglycerophosphate/cardiolipin synthase-like enzyme
MDDRPEGYSGPSSYKFVDPILFDDGKELLVISPYIGMGYAKKLVKLGGRKKVRVVTSRYSEQVSKFITHHSRYLLLGYVRAIAVIVAGAVIATYFSLYDIALLAAGLGVVVALAAAGMYKISRSSDVQVRIVYDSFVHEKAYISEGIAAVGSANLTFNGMHKNVERVELIRNPSRIASLRAHFFDLWKQGRR